MANPLRCLGVIEHLQLLGQAHHHVAVEQVAIHRLPQAVDHRLRDIVGVMLQQSLLTCPDTLELLKLNAPGRHGMQQEFDFGQQIEQRLVVERHLHILREREAALGFGKRVAPMGFKNEVHVERTFFLQVIAQQVKTFEGQFYRLIRIEPRHLGLQWGQPLCVALTCCHALGITTDQRYAHIGAVLGIWVVPLTNNVGNRQNPRLAAHQQIIDMGDLHPLEGHVIRHFACPIVHHLGTADGIDRRNELVQIGFDTLLPQGRVVVLGDLFVTPVVAHVPGMGQVHHAVAMAHTVIGVIVQKAYGLLHAFKHHEIIVGGKGHEGRGHLQYTVAHLVIQAAVGVLGQVAIVDARVVERHMRR